MGLHCRYHHMGHIQRSGLGSDPNFTERGGFCETDGCAAVALATTKMGQTLTQSFAVKDVGFPLVVCLICGVVG